SAHRGNALSHPHTEYSLLIGRVLASAREHSSADVGRLSGCFEPTAPVCCRYEPKFRFSSPVSWAARKAGHLGTGLDLLTSPGVYRVHGPCTDPRSPGGR